MYDKNDMSRLTLKPTQLRLIREIAHHGQLQLAAEALAMTQPAASRMLTDVERQIGAPLFDRQPKGMTPTEAGLVVIRRARVILRELTSIAQDVAALTTGMNGALRIGAVTGPAVSLLVAAIREIKHAAPQADITVEVLPSRDLLQQMLAGEMDLALCRILPEFDSHDFNILPMQDEGVAFLCRAAHPLANAPALTMTELSDYEWIMQGRGSPIREATLHAFANVGLAEPANIINSPSLILTIAYLSQSDAITAVSDEVAQLLMEPPVSANFARLRTMSDITVSPYFLLHLKRRPLSPLAARLRDNLADRSLMRLGG